MSKIKGRVSDKSSAIKKLENGKKSGGLKESIVGGLHFFRIFPAKLKLRPTMPSCKRGGKVHISRF